MSGARARATFQGAGAIGSLGLVPDALQRGLVTLPGGRACAVLEVRPLSLSLHAPEAREALEDAYHGVLAGLDFPVQLLVRAQLADARAYRARLGACLAREEDPALLRVLLDHQAHVERLLATALPLERHVYIVVPAAAERPRRGPRRARWPWPWRAPAAPEQAAGSRAAALLDQRCGLLSSGLRTLGLDARRLGDPELAALWYGCLCPRLARVQPLPPQVQGALAAPIVTTCRHKKGGRAHAPVSA